MAELSDYPGVSWYKTRNKWRAQIWLTAKTTKHIGYYDSEQEAGAAYRVAQIKYNATTPVIKLNEPLYMDMLTDIAIKKNIGEVEVLRRIIRKYWETINE